MQRAVPQQPKATCISRHISSDVAASFSPQVQRHNVVSLLQVQRQVLQDAPRLTGQDTWQAGEQL